MLKTIENLPDRSNLNLFCKEKGFAIYVLDNFAVHLMEEVRMAFLKKGYVLVLIGKQSKQFNHNSLVRLVHLAPKSLPFNTALLQTLQSKIIQRLYFYHFLLHTLYCKVKN